MFLFLTVLCIAGKAVELQNLIKDILAVVSFTDQKPSEEKPKPRERLIAPLPVFVNVHTGGDAMDKFFCHRLLLACTESPSGVAFERVVALRLAMVVRCLCHLGRTRVTMQQLFGRDVVLTPALETREFDLSGCAQIELAAPVSGSSLAVMSKESALSPGVYVFAGEGTTGAIDILLCCGPTDRIAIQCKFSAAVADDPHLDNSLAMPERARLRAALGLTTSSDQPINLPLVFIANFAASPKLKLVDNEAYVDRRGGRAFFSRTYADIVYGMTCSFLLSRCMLRNVMIRLCCESM